VLADASMQHGPLMAYHPRAFLGEAFRAIRPVQCTRTDLLSATTTTTASRPMTRAFGAIRTAFICGICALQSAAHESSTWGRQHNTWRRCCAFRAVAGFVKKCHWRKFGKGATAVATIFINGHVSLPFLGEK
jgi:hypothetical protein